MTSTMEIFAALPNVLVNNSNVDVEVEVVDVDLLMTMSLISKTMRTSQSGMI